MHTASVKSVAITSPSQGHIGTSHLTTKQMDNKTTKGMQTQVCNNIFIQCYMCLLSFRDTPALNHCPILWHAMTGSQCPRVPTHPPSVMLIIHTLDPGLILANQCYCIPEVGLQCRWIQAGNLQRLGKRDAGCIRLQWAPERAKWSIISIVSCLLPVYEWWNVNCKMKISHSLVNLPNSE